MLSPQLWPVSDRIKIEFRLFCLHHMLSSFPSRAFSVVRTRFSVSARNTPHPTKPTPVDADPQVWRKRMLEAR